MRETQLGLIKHKETKEAKQNTPHTQDRDYQNKAGNRRQTWRRGLDKETRLIGETQEMNEHRNYT